MFTGDESGNWLFRALHKAGFASQQESLHRSDGMVLSDCYMTATLRCAPPLNKPTTKEVHNCRSFLAREIAMLRNVRVVVGLGKIGFEAALSAFAEMGRIEYKRKPKFGHCLVYPLGELTFVASFHPSQQNTFTGRLTEPMFDRVFRTAKKVLERG